MKTFKDFYKDYDISTDELFTFVEVLADKAKLFNKSSIHALRNYAFWGKKIDFSIKLEDKISSAYVNKVINIFKKYN